MRLFNDFVRTKTFLSKLSLQKKRKERKKEREEKKDLHADVNLIHIQIIHIQIHFRNFHFSFFCCVSKFICGRFFRKSNKKIWNFKFLSFITRVPHSLLWRAVVAKVVRDWHGRPGHEKATRTQPSRCKGHKTKITKPIWSPYYTYKNHSWLALDNLAIINDDSTIIVVVVVVVIIVIVINVIIIIVNVIVVIIIISVATSVINERTYKRQHAGRQKADEQ